MNQELTLAIEAGIENGSVALLDEESVIAKWHGAEGTRTSEELLPQIASMLDEAGVKRSMISSIAVSRGPGSYTGVRVGLATAMGLSRSLNVLCIGVSTLKAIFLRFGEGEAAFSVIPIGRAGVCWQNFSFASESIQAGEVRSGTPEEFDQAVSSAPQFRILAHSSVITLPGAEFLAAHGSRVMDVGRDVAVFIGEAARRSDEGLEPIYARTMTFPTSTGEKIVR